ncbi:MAG: amidase, partial [Acidobacteria bacterium]
MKTRREFLASTGLGLVGTAVAPDAIASARAQEPTQEPTQEPAGMPPAFGTAKPVGPEVSAHTLVEAEKLVQMELSKKDLEQAAKTWRVNMAPLCERRVGPRKMELHDGLAPWSRWDPV